LFNELKEVSTGAIFENDPQVVPRLVPVKEFQYMPILQVVKDANLVHFRIIF